MKKLMLVGLGVMIASLVQAKSYYVDVEHENASNEPCDGRGSESLPYKTIQAAVDAAEADSGYTFATDTIWVKPGVYKDGGKEWTDNTKSVNYSRVCIGVKKLRLQATGSAADTFIVGAKDMGSSTGIGSAAIGGVRLGKAAAGSIVRGFTICDCAERSVSVDTRGSAFNGGQGGGSGYFADSIVSNCAGNTTIGSCTAVRCGFFNNYTENASRGLVSREASLLHCVMAGNYGTAGALVSMGVVVGCTAVNNANQKIQSSSGIYNIVMVNAGDASTLQKYSSNPLIESNNVYSAGYHVVSPATEDYRLASDSPAVNGGKAEFISKISVPAELEPYTDYAGNAIPTSGTIHCGAIQEVAEVKTGRVKFAADATAGAYGVLDGHRCRLPSYAASEAYPVLWQYAGTDGSCRVSHYARTGVPLVTSDFVFAETNGTIAVFAPAAGAAVMTITAKAGNAAAKVLTVDGSSTSATEDGSPENPYKTISAALAACTADGNVIHVKRGTYAGSLTFTKGTEIVADEGPDVTVLDANGEAAVVLGQGGLRSLLSGFTVRNGNAVQVFKGNSGSEQLFVRDCVVTNCTATDTIFNYCQVIRTKVLGCQSSRFVLDVGRMISSLVGGCTAKGGSDPAIFKRNVATAAFGSTISGNDSPYTMTASLSVWNSILEGGAAQSSTGAGNLVWALTDTTALPATGFTVGDPMVFNAAAGDARLLTRSAARACAEIPTGPGGLADAFTAYYSSDLSGCDYDFASGTADAGCLQDAFVDASRVLLMLSDRGGFEVTGISAGMSVVTEPTTVTVTRTYDSDHCCLGVRVNGTLEPFDASDRWTMTVTPTSGALTLEIVDYSTKWYVDANIVQDPGKTYDGMTKARAYKTAQKAMANAKLVGGDTVVLLEGVYDTGVEETDVMSGTTRLGVTRSRVVVPERITLEGEGDRAKIVIAGEPDPTTGGRGDLAVRGVYLMSGATLRNVTVTNGYTKAGGDNNALCTGGGVQTVRNKSCLVEDCVIADCHAYRGGGLEFGTARRTLFKGCVASDHGAVGAVCECFENCVFDGNTGTSVLHVPVRVDSCTFLNSTGAAVYGHSATTMNYLAQNCVIFGKTGNLSVYSRCVFVDSDLDPGYEHCSDCIWTNAAAAVLSGYAPVKGSCILIDAGTNDLYPSTGGATDFLGTPRILNDNKLDIGAVEYDWRKDYSKDLGRRVTVTDVAAGAKETESKTVALADGDTLVATVLIKPNEDPAFDWPIVVTDGTLTICRNGEVLETLESGTTTWKYVAEAATEELAFAYSGTGAATLGRKPGNTGMMLIFR